MSDKTISQLPAASDTDVGSSASYDIPVVVNGTTKKVSNSQVLSPVRQELQSTASQVTQLSAKVGELEDTVSMGGEKEYESSNTLSVQNVSHVDDIDFSISQGEYFTIEMEGTAQTSYFRLYINEYRGNVIFNSFVDGTSQQIRANTNITKLVIYSDCTTAGTMTIRAIKTEEPGELVKEFNELSESVEELLDSAIVDVEGQNTCLRKNGEWVEFDATRVDAVIEKVGSHSGVNTIDFSSVIPIQDNKRVGIIDVNISQGETFHISASDTASCSRFRIYYNVVNGTVLSNTDSIDTDVTAPFDITKLYIYATCEVSGTLTVEITQNVSATGLVKDVEELKSSAYNGRKWVLLGDSITAQGKFINGVKTHFGITSSVNFGVGGLRMTHRDDMENSNMGMCDTQYLSQVPSDANIITLMGGTNDWQQSMEIGSKTSTNVSEYCGALNTAIDYLMLNYPNARLIVMTPPYGTNPNKFQTLDAAGRYNYKNYSVKDYGNACIDVCRYRGIPCIDMSLCGWTDKNITTFVANDGEFGTAGAYLHPNNVGGKRMAAVIVGFLRSIEPLSDSDI